MRVSKNKLLTASFAALLAGAAAPALAANIDLFSPTKGDQIFPFAPPTATGPGTIDDMNIGTNVPGQVTTNYFELDTGTKTATAASGAATLNKMAGVVTSESLTTAAGADYTLTLTNADIAAADQVYASVQYGTSTTGTPAVAMVTPGVGQVVIVVQNIHASAALNGTIKISFHVDKN